MIKHENISDWYFIVIFQMHGLVMLFAHDQRNFWRTQPNQFHVAARTFSSNAGKKVTYVY